MIDYGKLASEILARASVKEKAAEQTATGIKEFIEQLGKPAPVEPEPEWLTKLKAKLARTKSNEESLEKFYGMLRTKQND